MGKIASVLLAVALLWAADDWTKVKGLKTGSDIRVYKIGSAVPITAKSIDVTERKLVVLIKDTETAINKTEIDHVDYQPPATKSATKTYTADGDSASMTISHGASRDGWQTVYQRKN